MSEPTLPSPQIQAEAQKPTVSRRTAIITGVAAVGAAGVGVMARQRESVFVARNQRYDGDLETTVRDGLLLTGFDPQTIYRKRVLLKPNLVEPDRARPQMTTHPAVILAVAHVFQHWGAEVVVGEAPGHVRDTMMALSESGVEERLQEAGIAFADLNYQQVQAVPNRGRRSKLKHFFFPESVLEASLVVSLPKMKTHHWMGMTGSLKNFYGVLPGCRYGWPKNVLHYHGIPETIIDINASLPPTIAVVDGIECMEGDGPILGSAKQMGLLLVGGNLPAVDATMARIMGLRPDRIPYLRLARRSLGPIHEGRIAQCGEPWESVESPFQVLDREHLRSMRAHADGPLVT
ncbi:MAG: DUF362 domain-containing protein [Planctomycetota bacterium]